MSEQELELPKGWAETNIGKLISPSTEKFNPLIQPQKTFIGLEHIERNSGTIIGKGSSKETRSLKTVFYQGDLLYGKLRPYLNKVCIPNFDGVCSTDILVFQQNKLIENKFLKFFLMKNDFVSFCTQNMTGTEHPRISFKIISDFIIHLPPLNEQKRIVSKIEELFSKIDSTKQLLEQTKLQLELYRQSLLQSAFEGKLVNNDSEDAKKIIDYLKIIENERKDEIFKHVLKNKKSEQYKFQEPRSYLEEEIPSISKKWHIASIETVCSLVSGGSTPLRTEEKNFSKTGFPLLKVENIPLNRGKIFLKNDQLRITKEPHNKKWQSKTYPNDVLINIVGPPLGKVGIVPENFPESNINQAIVLMRTVPSFLNKFLLYCLQSPQYYHFQIRLSTGVRQENIRKSLVGKFPIPIPSLEEQEQIVSQIEQGFSLIENTQRIVNSTLQTLQTMKMSVLKQAFEGKLVPQDPNDEPAEKLLERIKKEKS